MAEPIYTLRDGLWIPTTERTLIDGIWTVPGPLLPTDLAAKWTFDDGSGTDIVAARTLSLTNLQMSPARGGLAMTAPETLGTAQTSDGFLNLAGYSISMWVLPAVGTVTAAFSATGTDVAYLYFRWQLLASRPYRALRHQAITDAGSKNNLVNTPLGNSGDPYPAPVWEHIVGTYDQSNIYMYHNGVLIDTDAQTGTVGDPDTFRIELPVGAKIDDVEIWSRPLTGAEVLEQYNEGATP